MLYEVITHALDALARCGAVFNALHHAALGHEVFVEGGVGRVVDGPCNNFV